MQYPPLLHDNVKSTTSITTNAISITSSRQMQYPPLLHDKCNITTNVISTTSSRQMQYPPLLHDKCNIHQFFTINAISTTSPRQNAISTTSSRKMQYPPIFHEKKTGKCIKTSQRAANLVSCLLRKSSLSAH